MSDKYNLMAAATYAAMELNPLDKNTLSFGYNQRDAGRLLSRQSGLSWYVSLGEFTAEHVLIALPFSSSGRSEWVWVVRSFTLQFRRKLKSYRIFLFSAGSLHISRKGSGQEQPRRNTKNIWIIVAFSAKNVPFIICTCPGM